MKYNIDKDKFKEYINSKYQEKMRITNIHDISLHRMRYNANQLDPGGELYKEAVSKGGYVELDMIKPLWDGWKVVESRFVSSVNSYLVGSWRFQEGRHSNRYSLESYKTWLRDNKLKEIGI